VQKFIDMMSCDQANIGLFTHCTHSTMPQTAGSENTSANLQALICQKAQEGMHPAEIAAFVNIT